jgi:hypothetical protein
MSEFEDLLRIGFREVVIQAGSTITRSGQSAKCVILPAIETRAMQASGYFPEATSTIEMERDDLARLGLDLKAVCQLNGRSLRVVGIDDDATDPMVQVHLKLEQQVVVPR